MQLINRKWAVLFLVFTLLFTIITASACAPQRRPAPTPPAPAPAPAPAPQTPPQRADENAKADMLAKKIADMQNINSATVVISGNQAWVGVDLHANVKGQLSNQMKNDITNVVKNEVPNIQTVYVTADADTVTRLRDIARDIAAGRPVSGFINELTEIGRRITPSAK
ncbi:MAG: YhcN/YlaJ family sporulation lipoprotein [Bacillota bacterium]|nr:YhcN/YlaJ family sporulation lipoprotein [Thermanaerosceptrum fracticalcis]